MMSKSIPEMIPEMPYTMSDAARMEDWSTFRCPITHQLMEDPVKCADGHTYERAAITKWLERHHTSPMTREPMTTEQLFIDRTMKSQIDTFKAQAKEKNE